MVRAPLVRRTAWLEPNQVEALDEVPGSHLYVVKNVRSADPSADPSDIRILDLWGEQLKAQLEAKKEKRYFEVPLPVAVYDDLLSRSQEASMLDGVVGLHERRLVDRLRVAGTLPLTEDDEG